MLSESLFFYVIGCSGLISLAGQTAVCKLTDMLGCDKKIVSSVSVSFGYGH